MSIECSQWKECSVGGRRE